MLITSLIFSLSHPNPASPRPVKSLDLEIEPRTGSQHQLDSDLRLYTEFSYSAGKTAQARSSSSPTEGPEQRAQRRCPCHHIALPCSRAAIRTGVLPCGSRGALQTLLWRRGVPGQQRDAPAPLARCRSAAALLHVLPGAAAAPSLQGGRASGLGRVAIHPHPPAPG